MFVSLSPPLTKKTNLYLYETNMLSNTVIIIIIIAIIITIFIFIVALKAYKNQNPNQEKETEKESNSHVVVLTNKRVLQPYKLNENHFGGKRKKKRFIKRKSREKPF